MTRWRRQLTWAEQRTIGCGGGCVGVSETNHARRIGAWQDAPRMLPPVGVLEAMPLQA